MLLRKQSSYGETFSAKLQFDPRKTGYEAGVVLWWSQYSFASIGIRLAANEAEGYSKTVALREPTGIAGEFKVFASLILDQELSDYLRDDTDAIVGVDL